MSRLLRSKLLPTSRRGWIRLTAVAACGLVLGAAALLIVQLRQAKACGGSPPPPVCGKSLALTKAVPGVIVVPPGPVVVPIGTTVFFGLVESPPGSGACPAPPYPCTDAITLACIPPPGAAASVTVPIVPGPNAIVVPVTIPAGPPRVCTVTGTATLTLSDGQMLSATGDATLCLVRAAPGMPNTPEVDMQIVGSASQRVHPGDMACYRVRMCNNHPTQWVTGTLSANSRNTSRLPNELVGGPPGTGVYAFSDPDASRMTDNYDLAWWDQVGGCVPLRANPQQSIVPTITRLVDLGPGGGCVTLIVCVRPFGMCSDGSCGESAIVYNYTRQDSVTGVGCATVNTIVDTNVAPLYGCADSGAVTCMNPLPSGGLIHQGRATQSDQWQIETELVQLQLISGHPISFQQQTTSSRLTNAQRPTCDYARAQTLMFSSSPTGLFPDNSFFDVFFDITFQPAQAASVAITQFAATPGAPTGFVNRAPMAMGRAAVQSLSGVQSFFDVFYQVEIDALTQSGQTIPIEILAMDITSVGSQEIRVHVNGHVATPTGQLIVALSMNNDYRGYASPRTGPPTGACCLTDAFPSCAIRTRAACEGKGGVYQGNGTNCTTIACRPRDGAIGRGDANCDDVTNNFDIDDFVILLTNPALYAVLHPNCSIGNCDMNGDGTVNNFDIDLFVAVLTGAAPNHCVAKVLARLRDGCGFGACPIAFPTTKCTHICPPPCPAPGTLWTIGPLACPGGGTCSALIEHTGVCDP